MILKQSSVCPLSSDGAYAAVHFGRRSFHREKSVDEKLYIGKKNGKNTIVE